MNTSEYIRYLLGVIDRVLRDVIRKICLQLRGLKFSLNFFVRYLRV